MSTATAALEKKSPMNDHPASKEYGVLIGPHTLRLQRRVTASVERVWAYLTESKLRRQWLAAGQMELRIGAPVELVWRNDELNDPPSRRPAGFPEEQRMRGRITELDPLRKLVITWEGGNGEVAYEMDRRGDDVLLTVIQRGLPSRDIVVMFAAGTHIHLDILDARLSGDEPPLFWGGWSRLQEDYAKRIPN